MKKLVLAWVRRMIRRLQIIEVANRLEILRQHGAHIGEGVFFEGEVNDYNDAPYLTLEDGATVSRGALIILHDSALNNTMGAPLRFGKVTIGAESFVGANATILCGVRIGRRSIVGAHSLVREDVPDDKIAVGVPARVVGSVPDAVEAHRRRAEVSDDRFWYQDAPPWRERDEREFLTTQRRLASRAVGTSGDPPSGGRPGR